MAEDEKTETDGNFLIQSIYRREGTGRIGETEKTGAGITGFRMMVDLIFLNVQYRKNKLKEPDQRYAVQALF